MEFSLNSYQNQTYRKIAKLDNMIDSYIRINHVSPKKATNLRLLGMFARKGLVLFNQEGKCLVNYPEIEITEWIEKTNEVKAFLSFFQSLLNGPYPNKEAPRFLFEKVEF